MHRRSEHFWSKVDKSRGPEACWPWMAMRLPTGYGQFYVGDGRKRGAHRVAFELATGISPGDHYVCHQCDYPPCCNPRHLWLGTAKDNNRDAIRKDRHARGARNRQAKLTDSDVLQMRTRVAAGERQCEVVLDYPIGRPALSLIVNRKTWRHI